MSKLYLECNSGISGDMFVAALLDLGVKQDKLLEALKSLPLSGYEIKISRVKKAGIDCCDFDVVLDETHETHDHDMEYLYGHDHDHDHSHEDHEHDHEHTHDHVHPHEHRGMAEITQIINAGHLGQQAKKTALRIFEILAQSESKAHGIPVSEVHFHEVGAVDSIVDVVAAAVCLESLGVGEVIVPSLSEGRGTVRCQHGILSIPVPAVSNIVSTHQIPLQMTNVQGELVTPTGAAIVAAICTERKLPGTCIIEKIGIGAGKRAYERPSMVRAMLLSDGEKDPAQKTSNAVDSEQVIYKLESNIDDCSGEVLGYLLEQLIENGARDVHYIPVFMKKNRPAYLLNVICMEAEIPKLEQIIFAETTTIGIRRIKMERSVLERKTMTVGSSFGIAVVKCCENNGETYYYPEYESVKQLAKQNDAAFLTVFEDVKQACREQKFVELENR